MTPGWHPNPGFPPTFTPLSDVDECPPDRIPATEAKGAKVFVKLRNGREPADSWPLLGSRWTLTGCNWDIAFWRRS
ncbi:MAG TPA: hypothetical protein VF503_09035 [Sphingobium sp.]|uniref:hypothetical protein n=1 Tax=Sphingobium sp. TaxID=1912891 RepID=UPI002ED0BED5